MPNQSSQHGGRRPGAGRPPLPPEQRQREVTVSLPPDVLAQAQAAGTGNVSRGVCRLVRRAAERAASDPFFVGFALARYQAREGLDEAALAARLGCPPAQLPRLALCRRPEPDTPSFAQDVQRIATWAGVDAGVLAALLTEVLCRGAVP